MSDIIKRADAEERYGSRRGRCGSKKWVRNKTRRKKRRNDKPRAKGGDRSSAAAFQSSGASRRGKASRRAPSALSGGERERDAGHGESR